MVSRRPSHLCRTALSAEFALCSCAVVALRTTPQDDPQLFTWELPPCCMSFTWTS
jgi:hypothetical protein